MVTPAVSPLPAMSSRPPGQHPDLEECAAPRSAEVIVLADARPRWVDDTLEAFQSRGRLARMADGAAEALHSAASIVVDSAVLNRVIRLRSTGGPRRWCPVVAVAPTDAGQAAVEALAGGADDCVSQDASAEEIVLRVERLLDRRLPLDSTPLALGPICIDQDRHRVEVHGEEVSLTPIQFQLLVTLATNPGRVVTKRELIEVAWDLHQEVDPGLLRPQLSRLRRAIEGAARLRSVPGVGYILDPMDGTGS